MANIPEFPKPIEFNGRKVFARSQVEYYKREIIAASVGGTLPAYEPPEVEEFVPARVVAQEIGFGRRTLGRRMAEITKSAAKVDSDGEAA
ncbi:hypothetical protein [Methylocystis rosea]|uniref:hypothetical protein n=1 Tax=Methylocystis rosea TaxID=173366 RepID=UPI00035F696C|nr:hypothetical protein [Methylocystis rosea]